MPPAQPQPAPRAREGKRGTTLSPARPAPPPNAGSSAKPLPDLPPPYDHGPTAPPHVPEKRPPEPLDTKRRRLGAATRSRPRRLATVQIGVVCLHPACLRRQ